MAKTTIESIPSLTKEKLTNILSVYGKPKGYEVGASSLIGADVFVKKSGWTGVTIKMKQKADGTTFKVYGYAPSMAVRLLIYGVITILILRPKWKQLENEIVSFIESEPFLAACKQ